MRLTMKRLFIVLVVLSKMAYAQILFTVDMQPDTVVEGELFSFTLYALEGDEQQLSFDGVLPSWLTLTDINVERTVGTVELVAGTGMASYIPQGLPAVDVPLYYPQKSTILPNGEIVITDAHNHGVHKVGLDGLLFTIAGTGTPGFSGDGGPAIDAKVWAPFGITNDNNGNIYFTNVYRIRKIDTEGIITTFAGDGTPGYSGDGGPASSAKINMLYGDITVDDYGNIYFCDTDNFRVRKIDTDGIITTIAGNGTLGYSGDGGPATDAQISHGYGIDTDTDGNIYFMDGWPNYYIRKIDVSSGIISSLYESNGGVGLTVDDNMNFYYTNMSTTYVSGDVVYKIDSEGSSSVIAGDGNCGFDGDGGDASQSVICRPHDVDIDNDGNIYITDLGNGRIRKIDTDNIINTIAGNGEIIPYDESGNPLETSFGHPNAVVLDDSSNYYVADAGFNAVRMIHQSSGLIETIAGTIGLEWGSSPDGTPANEAIIGGVRCLTFDNSGQLFFTEPWTYKVRYIDQDGILYTYAGSGEEGNSGDDGDALNASLGESHGIDFGPDGSLYFASNIQDPADDAWYGYLKKVSPEGIITTLAGNGTIHEYEFQDGEDASNTLLNRIFGVKTDQHGNVYFAIHWPHKIYMVCMQAGQYYGVDADSGKIYSIAGVTDEYGYNGTEIPANTAQLDHPQQMYFDEFGQLYFTDYWNQLIRKIDNDGTIYTIAGQPQQGGISEDGIPASESFFVGPKGVYVDDLGFIFVTEGFGRVVSKIIPPSATITGIAHIDSSLNRDIAQTFTGVVYASNGVDTDSVVFEITVVPGTQTSIGESTQLPMKFALHQNYPNPFNPITTLRYDLPENSLVNIIIYDIIGREVKTLVNTTQDAGSRSVIWDATNNEGKPVSAGVYLYQIQAGEFVQTKKMVLLK